MNNLSTINWTLPKILAAVMGMSWIAVQVSVPLFWLIERGFDPKPRQFGWQMYTNMAGGDRFFVVSQDNQIHEIDADDYTHNIRPGLNYGDNFLDYLCQKFPNAKQTQLLPTGDRQPDTYPCQN